MESGRCDSGSHLSSKPCLCTLFNIIIIEVRGMLVEASLQFWRKLFMFLIIPCQILNSVSKPCSMHDLMDISHYFTWIDHFPAFFPQVCKLMKELVLSQLSDQWVITLIALMSVWFLLCEYLVQLLGYIPASCHSTCSCASFCFWQWGNQSGSKLVNSCAHIIWAASMQ